MIRIMVCPHKRHGITLISIQKTPTPFEDVGVICLIRFFRLEQILYNYLTVTYTAFLIAFAVSHVPFTLAAIAT